jgi:ribokinase
MRVAVIGHVEWLEIVHVDQVPRAGGIAQGASILQAPAGGGGVAAVQLARWGADAHFFTAVGDDALGDRTARELRARGVTLHAARRPEAQRRAVTLVDAQRERTIILTGARHVARAADPLPWDALSSFDAVYITGGDVAAVRAGRAARVVVSTARILARLAESAIALDALVGSDDDPAERYDGELTPAPRLVVRTDGARGGRYFAPGGSVHGYAPVPTEVTGDTYGAGDTFAAALTLALGAGKTPSDAIAFAAARAAEVLAWDGPYPPPA